MKCDGWGKRDCENKPVVILRSPCCKYCGGSDCGDSGDSEASCLVCTEPFKAYALKNTDMVFEIIDFEENVIWSNQ